MLTRLYLDNYRSFENFEYKLNRKQLIFGSNGTGKSSFVDAVLLIRQIAVTGSALGEFHLLSQRTRWLTRTAQTFELEASLDGATYIYKLVLEPHEDPPRVRIALESLHLSRVPLFEFENREVRLYSDQQEQVVSYPFDADRSALATIAPRNDNQRLIRFKLWLSSLFCFRINPFAISGRAESEQLSPKVQMDNLASWYRHLLQSDQRQNFKLIENLQTVLDEFKFLDLPASGENVRLMVAEFGSGDSSARYLVHELSEGQRCLICLYTILHFLLAKGCTVIIDEPDNFLSLREIQPWLMAASDVVEDTPAQMIIISHHPEIIDQWAPSYGTQFFRVRGGPSRVKEFAGNDSKDILSPSELIARGWLE